MKQVKQMCMYNVGLILEFQLGPFLLDLSCFSWPTYSNFEEFEKKKNFVREMDYNIYPGSILYRYYIFHLKKST